MKASPSLVTGLKPSSAIISIVAGALSSTSNENDPSEEVVVVYVAPSQVASPSESVTGIHIVADWI